MANEYVTTAEYKSYMRIKADDVLDDEVIPTFTEAASRGLDEYCGRVFYAASPATDRYYVADDRCTLQIDDIYSTAGLVLQVDTSDDGTFDTTWTLNTDFQLEPLNGVVTGVAGHPYTLVRALSSARFPISRFGRRNVKITALFGWTSTPPVIKMATLELAKDLAKSRDFAAGAIGFGDVFARIRDNPSLVSRLSPYRHPQMLMVG